MVCKICDASVSSKGFNGHVTKHGISVDEYVARYGEYRKRKLQISALEKVCSCKICNIEFQSEFALSHHLRTEHGLKKSEYVLRYIFNDTKPLCECGCGTEVKITGTPPYRRQYVSGHNPNGMLGKHHKTGSRDVMRTKAIERGVTIKKDTLPELQFERFLEENSIKYVKQYKTDAGLIDFCVDNKWLVEIDGEYWHPLQFSNLNFKQIQSGLNDIKKNRAIKDLIRIRANDVPKLKTISDIHKFNRKSEYPDSVQYKTPICAKEYLISTHDSLNEFKVGLLLRFLREIQPEFPTVPTEENLDDILQKIPEKAATVKQNDVFNNNCSNVGVNYLKSTFRTYWESSYRGNKTPIQIWNDDEMMRNIIKYRIGMNSKQETFNFSLHQMIRGISAIRGTVSFFKPVLAAAVYSHYLGDIEEPIVVDPCAGFGGRMLGFKAMYPKGKYIGIEPNIDTYNELLELSKTFSDVTLYNMKFEDYNDNTPYNLMFTSIPYYDKETYSNPVEYNSFETWVQEFVMHFYRFDNVILNIPIELHNAFPGSKISSILKSNASHLSRLKTKEELLIRINPK